MGPNPVLKKLGFAEDDRLVIIHADDVGMCQASLAAYADLVDSGLVSAASTMVPCPWFPATATFCRERADDKVDMGVHVTLTSEWQGYRWGPISTRDPASGLIDDARYFYATSEDAGKHGDPNAVRHEIEAQVDCALEVGVDVTHVDTHMGAIVHPEFVLAYVQAAFQRHIPPLLVRKDEAGLRELGVDAEAALLFAGQLQAFEAQGVPLLDDFHEMPLDQPDDRLEQVKEVLAALPSGLTQIMIHPACNTPELRAITPDWRARVADYETFTSKALDAYVRDCGIHVIGWRILRDLMARGGSTGT